LSKLLCSTGSCTFKTVVSHQWLLSFISYHKFYPCIAVLVVKSVHKQWLAFHLPLKSIQSIVGLLPPWPLLPLNHMFCWLSCCCFQWTWPIETLDKVQNLMSNLECTLQILDQYSSLFFWFHFCNFHPKVCWCLFFFLLWISLLFCHYKFVWLMGMRCFKCLTINIYRFTCLQ